MYQYYFEKLNVWDEIRELVKLLYKTCETSNKRTI